MFFFLIKCLQCEIIHSYRIEYCFQFSKILKNILKRRLFASPLPVSLINYTSYFQHEYFRCSTVALTLQLLTKTIK